MFGHVGELCYIYTPKNQILLYTPPLLKKKKVPLPAWALGRRTPNLCLGPALVIRGCIWVGDKWILWYGLCLRKTKMSQFSVFVVSLNTIDYRTICILSNLFEHTLINKKELKEKRIKRCDLNHSHMIFYIYMYAFKKLILDCGQTKITPLWDGSWKMVQPWVTRNIWILRH